MNHNHNPADRYLNFLPVSRNRTRQISGERSGLVQALTRILPCRTDFVMAFVADFMAAFVTAPRAALKALGAAALLALAAPAWAQTAPTITVPTDLTHEEDANAENRFTFVEANFNTDFNDPDGDSFAGVVFTRAPDKGMLVVGSSDIAADEFPMTVTNLSSNAHIVPDDYREDSTVTIFFRVTDGTDESVDYQMELAVTGKNDAPTLSIEDQTVNDGSYWRFTVFPEDPDLDDTPDTMTYSAELVLAGTTSAYRGRCLTVVCSITGEFEDNAIDWLAFGFRDANDLNDGANGAADRRSFIGVPPYAKADYTITLRVTATDGGNEKIPADFTLMVVDVDHPPIVNTPLSGLEVTEDAALDFTDSNFTGGFADSDRDAQTGVIFTRKPRYGSLMNGSAAVADDDYPLEVAVADIDDISFVSGPEDRRKSYIDTFWYRVVSDSTGADANPNSIEHAADVLVTSTNDAPAFPAREAADGSALTPIADQAVTEGGSFYLVLPRAADADIEDEVLTLTYDVKLLTDAVAGTTADLPTWLRSIPRALTSTFLDLRTLRGVPAHGDVGTITLRASVTDQAGGTSFTDFDLVVAGAELPPTVTPPTGLTFAEGGSLTFTMANFTEDFSDPDGDTQTGVVFTRSPTGGTLANSGTPILSTSPIGLADIGNITLTAGNDNRENFAITVWFQVSSGTDDAALNSAEYYTRVLVTSTNDAPTATAPDTAPTLDEEMTRAAVPGTSLTDGDFRYADDDADDTAVGPASLTVRSLPVLVVSGTATTDSAGQLVFDGTPLKATDLPFVIADRDNVPTIGEVAKLVFHPVNAAAAYTARYTATLEDRGGSSSAVVNFDMSVTADDDAPRVISTSPRVVDPATAGEAYALGLMNYIADPEGTGTLTFTKGASCDAAFDIAGTSLVGSGTAGNRGGVIPADTTPGVKDCTITASDGTNSDDIIITVTVLPSGLQLASPPPAAPPGTAGMAYSLDLPGFFAAPAGTRLTYTEGASCDAAFDIAGAYLVGSADGIIPAATTSGFKHCAVTASDGTATATASFRVDVAGSVSGNRPEVWVSFDYDKSATVNLPSSMTADGAQLTALVNFTANPTQDGDIAAAALTYLGTAVPGGAQYLSLWVQIDGPPGLVQDGVYGTHRLGGANTVDGTGNTLVLSGYPDVNIIHATGGGTITYRVLPNDYVRVRGNGEFSFTVPANDNRDVLTTAQLGMLTGSTPEAVFELAPAPVLVNNNDGTGTVTFTVMRTGGGTGAVMVSLAATSLNGRLATGELAKTVSFADGDMSAPAVFTLSGSADVPDVITVTLTETYGTSAPSTYAVGRANTAAVRVPALLDPEFQLKRPLDESTANSGFAFITVERASNSMAAATVTISHLPTVPQTFAAGPLSVTIPAGQASAVLKWPRIGKDAQGKVVEATPTFTLLAGTGYRVNTDNDADGNAYNVLTGTLPGAANVGPTIVDTVYGAAALGNDYLVYERGQDSMGNAQEATVLSSTLVLDDPDTDIPPTFVVTRAEIGNPRSEGIPPSDTDNGGKGTRFPGRYGELHVRADGAWTYEVLHRRFGAYDSTDADTYGTETFFFYAADDRTNATLTLDLRVAGRNELPGIDGTITDLTVPRGDSFEYTFPRIYDWETASGDLTVALTRPGFATPGWLGLSRSGDGSWVVSGTPLVNNASGDPFPDATLGLEVSVTDGDGASVLQRFNLHLIQSIATRPQVRLTTVPASATESETLTVTLTRSGSIAEALTAFFEVDIRLPVPGTSLEAFSNQIFQADFAIGERTTTVTEILSSVPMTGEGDITLLRISDSRLLGRVPGTMAYSLPVAGEGLTRKITLYAHNTAPALTLTSSDPIVREAGGIGNATAGDPRASGRVALADRDALDDLMIQATTNPAEGLGGWLEGSDTENGGKGVALEGTYGTLYLKAVTLGTAGTGDSSTTGLATWTYELDDDDPDTQALDVGEEATDRFHIRGDNGDRWATDQERLDCLGASQTGGADCQDSAFARFSAAQEVIITLLGANDHPEAVLAGAPPVPVAFIGSAYSLNLGGYFTDADGDTLTYTLEDDSCDTAFSVSGGNLVGSGTGGLVPATTAVGSQTCQLEATDGATAEYSLTISVQSGSNTAPTAADDAVSVSEDALDVEGNVLTGDPDNSNAGADSDADTGQTLSVTRYAAGSSLGSRPTAAGDAAEGSYGSLTIEADGAFVYAPDRRAQVLAEGATATDAFTYEVADDAGAGNSTATATLTVTITGKREYDPRYISGPGGIASRATFEETATSGLEVSKASPQDFIGGIFTAGAPDGGTAINVRLIPFGGSNLTLGSFPRHDGRNWSQLLSVDALTHTLGDDLPADNPATLVDERQDFLDELTKDLQCANGIGASTDPVCRNRTPSEHADDLLGSFSRYVTQGAELRHNDPYGTLYATRQGLSLIWRYDLNPRSPALRELYEGETVTVSVAARLNYEQVACPIPGSSSRIDFSVKLGDPLTDGGQPILGSDGQPLIVTCPPGVDLLDHSVILADGLVLGNVSVNDVKIFPYITHWFDITIKGSGTRPATTVLTNARPVMEWIPEPTDDSAPQVHDHRVVEAGILPAGVTADPNAKGGFRVTDHNTDGGSIVTRAPDGTLGTYTYMDTNDMPVVQGGVCADRGCLSDARKMPLPKPSESTAVEWLDGSNTANGNKGTRIEGTYGDLYLKATTSGDATWTYELDNDDPDTQALSPNGKATGLDAFIFRADDRNAGDPQRYSTYNHFLHLIEILVTGATDHPTLSPPAGLTTDGDTPLDIDEAQLGYSAIDGEDTLDSLTFTVVPDPSMGVLRYILPADDDPNGTLRTVTTTPGTVRARGENGQLVDITTSPNPRVPVGAVDSLTYHPVNSKANYTASFEFSAVAASGKCVPGGAYPVRLGVNLQPCTETASMEIAVTGGGNDKPQLARSVHERQVLLIKTESNLQHQACGRANTPGADPKCLGALVHTDPDMEDLDNFGSGILQGTAGDGTSPAWTAATTAGATIVGTFGDLTLMNDGNWSYALDHNRQSTMEATAAEFRSRMNPPITTIAERELLQDQGGRVERFSFRMDDGTINSANRYSDILTITVYINLITEAPGSDAVRIPRPTIVSIEDVPTQMGTGTSETFTFTRNHIGEGALRAYFATYPLEEYRVSPTEFATPGYFVAHQPTIDGDFRRQLLAIEFAETSYTATVDVTFTPGDCSPTPPAPTPSECYRASDRIAVIMLSPGYVAHGENDPYEDAPPGRYYRPCTEDTASLSHCADITPDPTESRRDLTLVRRTGKPVFAFTSAAPSPTDDPVRMEIRRVGGSSDAANVDVLLFDPDEVIYGGGATLLTITQQADDPSRITVSGGCDYLRQNDAGEWELANRGGCEPGNLIRGAYPILIDEANHYLGHEDRDVPFSREARLVPDDTGTICPNEVGHQPSFDRDGKTGTENGAFISVCYTLLTPDILPVTTTYFGRRITYSEGSLDGTAVGATPFTLDFAAGEDVKTLTLPRNAFVVSTGGRVKRMEAIMFQREESNWTVETFRGHLDFVLEPTAPIFEIGTIIETSAPSRGVDITVNRVTSDMNTSASEMGPGRFTLNVDSAASAGAVADGTRVPFFFGNGELSKTVHLPFMPSFSDDGAGDTLSFTAVPGPGGLMNWRPDRVGIMGNILPVNVRVGAVRAVQDFLTMTEDDTAALRINVLANDADQSDIREKLRVRRYRVGRVNLQAGVLFDAPLYEVGTTRPQGVFPYRSTASDFVPAREDYDTDTMAVAITGTTALEGVHGSLTIDARGNLTYTPRPGSSEMEESNRARRNILKAGESVTEIISYEMSTTTAPNVKAVGEVHITITGVDDLPMPPDDIFETVITSALPYQTDGLGSLVLIDPDADRVRVVDYAAGADSLTAGAPTNPVAVSDISPGRSEGVMGSYGEFEMGSNGQYGYLPTKAAIEALTAGTVVQDVITYKVGSQDIVKVVEGGEDEYGPFTDYATATVTFTISSGGTANVLPVANDDVHVTNEDAAIPVAGSVVPVEGDVIAGTSSNADRVEPGGADSDLDSATLTVTRYAKGTALGSSPTDADTAIVGDHGTLTLMADGSYTYAVASSNSSLSLGAENRDEFTYEISDGVTPTAGTDTATITFVIEGRNDRGTVVQAAVDTSMATEVGVDAQGDAVAATSASATFAVSDVDTDDTHRCQARHGSGPWIDGSDTANGNKGAEIEAVYGSLFLKATMVSSGRSLCAYTYELDNDSPAANALGPDDDDLTENLMLRTVDQNGNSSTVFSLQDHRIISVNGTNDNPVAELPIPPLQAKKGAAFSFTIFDDAFSDPEGDDLALTAALADGTALPGWLTFATGAFSATAVPTDATDLMLAVEVSDGVGGKVKSAAFALTIAEATDNLRPMAIPDRTTTNEDAAGASGDVEANDTDPDADILTVSRYAAGASLGSSPIMVGNRANEADGTYGALTISGDGSYTYRLKAESQALAAGERQRDTFTYEIGDGTDVATSALTVTVEGRNDAPTVVQGDSPATHGIDDVMTGTGSAFSYTVAVGETADFHDPDMGDNANLAFSATYRDGNREQVVPLPGSGGFWLKFDPATRTFSGMTDAAGVQVITVTATDQDGLTGSDNFRLSVGLVSVLRVGSAISPPNAPEDSPFTFSLPSGAFLGGEGTVTYSASHNGAALPLPAASTGLWLRFDPSTRAFSGTPDNDDVGSYIITVTAVDETSPTPVSVTSEGFTVTVVNVNDAPSAVPVASTIADDRVLTFTAMHFGFDDDDEVHGDALSHIIIKGLPDPLHGALMLGSSAVAVNQEIDADDIGTLTFNPVRGSRATATVRYQVHDGEAASSTATLNIQIVEGKPAVVVSIATLSPQANTADPIRFTITRENPSVNTEAVTVSVAITTVGGYVTAETLTVPLPLNTNTATLEVDRLNPDSKVLAAGGSVTATLETMSGQNYGLTTNMADRTATFNVVDILPAAAMAAAPAAPAGDVEELVFTLNRIGSNMGAMMVPVTIASTEQTRVVNTTLMADFGAGDMSATVTVPLLLVSALADVTATIAAPGPTPTYIRGTDNSRTVSLPLGIPPVVVVSIEAASQLDTVDPIVFNIIRDNPTETGEAVTVSVDIATNGGYVTAATQTVVLPEDAPSVNLNVRRVTPNTKVEMNGGDVTATLALAPGQNYERTADVADRSATFAVVDTLPAVAMAAAPAAPAADATEISFTLSRIGSNMAAMTVPVTIASTVDTRVADGTASVTFAEDAASAMLIVPLLTDLTNATSVTVTIDAPGTNPTYIRGTANSRTVAVVAGAPSIVPAPPVTPVPEVDGDPTDTDGLVLTTAHFGYPTVPGTTAATDAVVITLPDPDFGTLYLGNAAQTSPTITVTREQLDAMSLRLVPTNRSEDTFNIPLRYTTTGSTAITTPVTLVIPATGGNDAPVKVGSIGNADVEVGSAAFMYTITVGLTGDFNDLDAGDNAALTFTATYSTDGGTTTMAVPAPNTGSLWLKLDGITGAFSGTPAETDSGIYTIEVTATDRGGLTAMSSFTLTVGLVPMPPTTPVQGVEGDPTATDGLMLTATHFGYGGTVATDAVVITLPDPDFGTLYLNNMAQTRTAPTDTITVTRTQLDANQLRLVPANRAGRFTIPLVYYTTGTINTPSRPTTLNVPAEGVNRAPTVVRAVPRNAVANLDELFNLPIAEYFGDKNPGDNLRFTATYSTDGGTTTMAVPAPGTGSFWLKLSTTGMFSSRVLTAADIGIYTIDVTATDGGGLTAMSSFTLTVVLVPMPPTMPVPGVEGDPTATDGLMLTTAHFGYPTVPGTTAATDAVVITLPDPDFGTLYLGNAAQTSPTITVTREQLDAMSLRLVPANRAGRFTIPLEYYTTGTTDTTGRPMTLNVPAVGVNRAPTLVAGIMLDREANLNEPFSLNIAEAFNDENPGDNDNLRFTATYSTDGGTTTMAVPAPGTGSFWLKLDSATGMFSSRALTVADIGIYTIDVTATDGGGLTAMTTFTLTVGLPMFRIVEVKHEPDGGAKGQVRVTLGLAEGSAPVARETIVTVRVTATNRYIDEENGKLATATFTASNMGDQDVRVDLDRNFGPSAMAEAEIVKKPTDYRVAEQPLEDRQGPIAGNDRDVRNANIRDGMAGVAFALGWDLTEAISKRSSLDHRGGGMRIYHGTAKQVDMDAVTRHLTRKLTSRIDSATSRGSVSGGGANQILSIVDALNDRRVGGASAAYGRSGYGRSGYGRSGYGRSAGKTDSYGAAYGSPYNETGAVSLVTAAEVAGQGIYPADSIGQSGGNAGTIYTGVAMDAKGWLIGLGKGKVTRTLDDIYSTMEASLINTLPDKVAIWTDIKHSNLDFGNATNYGGELTSFRMGYEKLMDDRMTLGLVVGSYGSDLDITNASLVGFKGGLEIAGWTMNPYLLWSGEAARFWVTVGFGQGDLEYEDTLNLNNTNLTKDDTTDTGMAMVAGGMEYLLANDGRMEVLGRAEVMSLQMSSGDAKDGLFDAQETRASGARGEMEVGWPRMMDGEGWLGAVGSMRPYLTMGYRWDGGDVSGSTAFEYGAGMTMQMDHFTFDGSVRTQGSAGADDIDRTSYNLSFNYDRERDQRGMMLTLSQDQGVAAMDPFAAGAFDASRLALGGTPSGGTPSGGNKAGGSSYGRSSYGTSGYSSGADRVNARVGYGFALTNKTLTIHTATDFNQGVQGTSEYGLVLETFGKPAQTGADAEGAANGRYMGTPSTYELLFTRKPGYGTAEDADAILLRLNREF